MVNLCVLWRCAHSMKLQLHSVFGFQYSPFVAALSRHMLQGRAQRICIVQHNLQILLCRFSLPQVCSVLTSDKEYAKCQVFLKCCRPSNLCHSLLSAVHFLCFWFLVHIFADICFHVNFTFFPCEHSYTQTTLPFFPKAWSLTLGNVEFLGVAAAGWWGEKF